MIHFDLATIAWLMALGAAAVAGLLARRHLHTLRRALAEREQRLDQLERDFRALCAADARVGSRVLDLERDLRRVMQWQSQMELRSPQTESLRHAINLVDRGASVDDLVSACGLSRGEAELMARIRSRAA